MEFELLLEQFVKDNNVNQVKKDLFDKFELKISQNSINDRFNGIRDSMANRKEYFQHEQIETELKMLFTYGAYKNYNPKDLLRISRRKNQVEKWKRVYWLHFSKNEVHLYPIYINSLKVNPLLEMLKNKMNMEVSCDGIIMFKKGKLVVFHRETQKVDDFKKFVNDGIGKFNGILSGNQTRYLYEYVFRYNNIDQNRLIEIIKTHLKKFPILGGRSKQR